MRAQPGIHAFCPPWPWTKRASNWNVSVALVDNHGTLVYCEMMNDTQTAIAVVAIEKAKTSATYRPAKEFEDGITIVVSGKMTKRWA